MIGGGREARLSTKSSSKVNEEDDETLKQLKKQLDEYKTRENEMETSLSKEEDSEIEDELD